MKEYQFYLKNGSAVHLDIASVFFEDEQNQLLEQGFEVSGKPITAKSVDEAYKVFNNEYAKNGIVSSILDVSQVLATRAILGG